MAKTTVRCAGYARDTSWKKDKNTLIEEQELGIRSVIAKKPDWELVEMYTDHGSSHEGLSAMMKSGLEGQVDCILFQSIYFAAGNFTVLSQKIEDTLYPAGIRFYAIEEAVDSGNLKAEELHSWFDTLRRERHCDVTRAWKESTGCRVGSYSLCRRRKDNPPVVYCKHCGKAMKIANGAYVCKHHVVEVEKIEMAVMDFINEEQVLAAKLAERVKAGFYEKQREAQTAAITEEMKKAVAEAELDDLQKLPLYQPFRAGAISENGSTMRAEAMRGAYRELDQKIGALMKRQAEVDKGYSLKNLWLTQYLSNKNFLGTRRENMRLNTERIEYDGEIIIKPKQERWKWMLCKIQKKECALWQERAESRSIGQTRQT